MGLSPVPCARCGLRSAGGGGGRATYRVVRLGRDGVHHVRVPDDQVGVGAHGDPALAGVEVQDLGGVGAGHRHKHVLVHFARGLQHNGQATE